MKIQRGNWKKKQKVLVKNKNNQRKIMLITSLGELTIMEKKKVSKIKSRKWETTKD